MKVNYHAHTKRCGHAENEMEEYVLAAINEGYDILGFSDHAPFKGISQKGIRMEYDELDDYINEFNYLKEKYKDKIELHLGLEIEYMKKYEDYYRFLLKEKKIEYLLLGQHCFINDNNEFEWYGRRNSSIRAKDMIEGMKTGFFSYCAHPDIFINEESVNTEEVKKLTQIVIQTSIDYDIPLEINAQGVLVGEKLEIDAYYPFESFWKEVGKSKAKVIIGVDAHSASAFKGHAVKYCHKIADKFNIKLLDKLDFKKIR